MCPLQVFQAIFDGEDLGRSDAIYNVSFDSAHGTDYRARYQGVYKDPVAGGSLRRLAGPDGRRPRGAGLRRGLGGEGQRRPRGQAGAPPTLSDVAGMAAQSQALLQARASGRQRSFLIDAAPLRRAGAPAAAGPHRGGTAAPTSPSRAPSSPPAPRESPAVAAQGPLTRPAPLGSAPAAPSPGRVAAVQTGETPAEAPAARPPEAPCWERFPP